MIEEEKLKQLEDVVGKEVADTISELHEKHDGEIALAIKRGKAYVTKKPTYDEVARYNSDTDKPHADTFLVGRKFVMRHLIYPTPEEAEVGLCPNALMVASLAGKTLKLTAEDESFDLEGN